MKGSSLTPFHFPCCQLLSSPLEKVSISNTIVERTARKTFGSGGPTFADSTHWFDVLIYFGQFSSKLRLVFDSLVSLLANQNLPWWKIRALSARRVVALDKNRGIRPIGIEETLRRILVKCFTDVVGDDWVEVFGVDQLAGRL